MSNATATPADDRPILDWPYLVPSALVQRIVDVAAIERIDSTPTHWMGFQTERIGQLLMQVKATHPWWDEWLGGGGADLERVRSTLSNWQRQVPVLGKDQLRQSIAAMPHPKLQEGEPAPGLCSTRGTTGEPIELLRSSQGERLSAHQFHADHFRHGRPLWGNRAVIANLNQDHEGDYTWVPAVGELNESITLARKSTKFTLVQHLNWLREARIDQLTVSTDFLAQLTTAAEAQRETDPELEPVRIGHILTAGDVMPTELRERVRSAFGAPLFDRYVCEEAGPLAMQARGGHLPGAAVAYNCMQSHVLVEVLNADGTHVADGEDGSVTVTALHELLHPVIRYALGDRARWHAKCPLSGALIPTLTDIRRG